jgi:transcription antitermination protein NusB
MNPENVKTDDSKGASRRMARKRAFEICFEATFYSMSNTSKFVNDRVDNPVEFDPTDPEGNIVALFEGENLKFIEVLSVLTILNATLLDEILMKYPWEWSYDRIGLPEKVILRMALAELTLMDTPLKIVINEALDLSKAYGERDANKFVNGILGSIVQDLDKIKKETQFTRE